MKEKFEHKITERIKEVFSSGQVEYNPQDWEKMKMMLPAKRKKAVVLLWTFSKVAAVVLLFLAGYFLFMNRSTENENITINENKQISTSDTLDENLTLSSIKDTSNSVSEFDERDQISIIDKPYQVQDEIHDNQKDNKLIVSDKEIAVVSNENENQLEIITQAEKNITIDTVSVTDDFQGSELAEIDAPNNNVSTDTNNSRNQNIVPPQIYFPPSKKEKDKIKFGITLASFTNYSPEDITQSMNYGGGLAANIPVKGRFSFNPGLVLSSINMSYDESSEHLNSDQYEVLTTFGVNELADENTGVQPTAVQLTGLDIPLNFQYKFLKRKKGSYFIEMGVSSLLYLSENYTYSFSYFHHYETEPGTLATVLKTVDQESSIPAFKTFDFARLLNFSVGLDYRLSNRFDMVINPYLKYPVSSLSAADLKFGSGGLKLKFMLIPKK